MSPETFKDLLNDIFFNASAVLALLSAAGGVFGAYLSWRNAKVAEAEIKISAGALSGLPHIVFKREGGTDGGPSPSATREGITKPFEVEALANYYNQALSRANISFWFSLIFASVGFGVIIFAFITHTQGDLAGTIVKVASGAVIDAVSGLFFVQSTNAQKSMAEFFEKLRLDRLNAEAREMISEIENVATRDQLRSQLILKYSGIERLLVGN
ncbi:TRADD-N-associated membrane domain-containing protein [Roseomonas sp. WA12]